MLIHTLQFDESGENSIAVGELGSLAPKDIPGYTYTGKSYTEDGILKHIYKANGSSSDYRTGFNGVPADNSNPGHQGDGEPRQGNRPTSSATTPSTPANETPSTPASGTDTPATPTAETPATPAVAPAVAATSQDNTYQAPAAKSEDKKELPNTGGKDNAAIASLGFLGLLLGALPFVKRKN